MISHCLLKFNVNRLLNELVSSSVQKYLLEFIYEYMYVIILLFFARLIKSLVEKETC